MAQYPYPGASGMQQVRAFAEAASQTFIAGDFVGVDSNGRAQQLVAAGSSLGATSGAITNRVLGRATDPASGTTGRLIDVCLAEGKTYFKLPIYSATPGNSVANTNLLGKQYGIRHVAATGAFPAYYAVNVDDPTNVKCKIVDFVLEDMSTFQTNPPAIPTAASTTPQTAYVWVEFMEAHTIFGGGA